MDNGQKTLYISCTLMKPMSPSIPPLLSTLPWFSGPLSSPEEEAQSRLHVVTRLIGLHPLPPFPGSLPVCSLGYPHDRESKQRGGFFEMWFCPNDLCHPILSPFGEVLLRLHHTALQSQDCCLVVRRMVASWMQGLACISTARGIPTITASNTVCSARCPMARTWDPLIYTI